MRTLEINCCIEHEGQKFCTHGSYISDDYILAYLNSDGTKITTWRGQTLTSRVRILSKRYCSSFGEDGYYLRFQYRNMIYSGFALCKGGIVKARKTKLKSLWS